MNAQALADTRRQRERITERPLGCLAADVTTDDGDGYGPTALARYLFPAFMSDDRISAALDAAGIEVDGAPCRCRYTGGDCCGQWFSGPADFKRGRVYVVVRQGSAVDC